ncbi:MAG: AraC family transcriptional regulator [Muribaculaceae bacterium]|nr:AraC family transcriptional regulator [Muribaculaceae bacterium]
MNPQFPASNFSPGDDPKIEIRNIGREVIDLPIHSHTHHQIIHTVSGTLRIQVEERNHFVPEHHVAWIPPGVNHLLSSNNRNIALQVIYCRLPHSPNDDFRVLRSNSLIEEVLRFSATQKPLVCFHDDPELYNFYISFLLLLRKRGETYATPLKGMAIPSDHRLKAILAYIDDHLEENLGIPLLSAEFGLSERNLSRLFHDSGLRMTDYINYQRVIRAIELLTEGDRSIQEVAYDVGYNSPNHFNRVFKQISGLTPHEYLCKGMRGVRPEDIAQRSVM